MRISKTRSGSLAIVILLSGCGDLTHPPRPLPPVPFAYLSLTACRAYASNIVECQLEYGTQFGRQRLGPVQQTGLNISGGDSRYQVASCYPISRIQKELPNFVCRIYSSQSGVHTGSVLIKGGTAVRLARILGDREQIQYRWTSDKWSRLHD
ncbi:hypothetical protein E0H35_35885 [Rhizobium leguminosarum bv. viciae]|uniref:Lipoprotein n=1 Tax=Rhizobium changzhiense TaxID=2692317 RepID=A0A7Z0RKX2_9HYPH|nr:MULTISPECIES: hypothetical protein [Rhizobium]MBB4345637.1 hypothetical protein [Rhizobium leguminosarum]MBB5262330.1 hypothetical protein [Rhizobium leguminosarum]MBB6298709.1 hypothetical protein [Rhizobium leguminosarum]MBY3334613.1 hypothetical protein [Rhizobium laguerreae]MBY5345641.1 hypothetical protein [Rhizobium leguminosarum]